MDHPKQVLEAYAHYIEARHALLNALQLKRQSNRDPLSEFSEWLVAYLVHGTLADSPVQKDWDVQRPNGEKIQVKYLANSTDRWVNEHEVRLNEQMDCYALVIFEMLLPQSVIFFPADNLATIGMALGKKHGNLGATLQFTQKNYHYIRNHIDQFKVLGVSLSLAPDWTLQ